MSTKNTARIERIQHNSIKMIVHNGQIATNEGSSKSVLNLSQVDVRKDIPAVAYLVTVKLRTWIQQS